MRFRGTGAKQVIAILRGGFKGFVITGLGLKLICSWREFPVLVLHIKIYSSYEIVSNTKPKQYEKNIFTDIRYVNSYNVNTIWKGQSTQWCILLWRHDTQASYPGLEIQWVYRFRCWNQFYISCGNLKIHYYLITFQLPSWNEIISLQ